MRTSCSSALPRTAGVDRDGPSTCYEEAVNELLGLLDEAVELVRERPCHRPDCINGTLLEPSHQLCQRIRQFVLDAENALAQYG